MSEEADTGSKGEPRRLGVRLEKGSGQESSLRVRETIGKAWEGGMIWYQLRVLSLQMSRK